MGSPASSLVVVGVYAGRPLSAKGVWGTAVNPSMEAAGAPSMARTLPQTPFAHSALLDVVTVSLTWSPFP